MTVGFIRHACYTAEIKSLTESRVTGILLRHVNDVCESRTFNVQVKNGKFRCTTNSGPSTSISEHFHLKHITEK